MFWIAVLVFVFCLVLFIFEWVDKTLVAIAGAVLLLLLGVLNWQEAIYSIDTETIILLFGLMLIVAVAQHSGIFSWLNLQIAEKSKGSPIGILILFVALTFFTSMFLSNATVVLLVVPIAIALASRLNLNTKVLVIALVMFSNIGGTMTLIGDPPNTLIGVKVGLSFNDFIVNLYLPILVMSGVILAYLFWVYRDSFHSIARNLPKMILSRMIIQKIAYQFVNLNFKKSAAVVTSILIGLMVLAFVFQPYLGVSIGILAMVFGVLVPLAVFRKIDFVEVMKEVEWSSLVFFMALFIQVGALEKVGALEVVTDFIAGFGGNYLVLLMVILWGLGLASMFINNIPFVALMIPVIFDLQARMAGQADLDLMWWALSLGACLGGNGTIIGSSAGVLAVDMAKRHGVHISFKDFMKVGMPVTILSLVVSSGYLMLRLYI